MLSQRVQEFIGDARPEKAEVRIDYRPGGTFLVGLAAKDVFGRAGREEAADALAHGLRGLVRAAHGAEEGCDLVGLEKQAGALEEFVLDRLAGGEGLGDGLAEVDALGEAGVGLAGVVLADAGVAEHHDVEVGARAVSVGVAAAREVREHGEGAGEREDAVGAVAGREREVGQLADEARHAGQLFRQRTRVGEGWALRGAFIEFNTKKVVHNQRLKVSSDRLKINSRPVEYAMEYFTPNATSADMGRVLLMLCVYCIII